MKIKNINIESFRAYNENVDFNLEKKNKTLANLFLIYAPNGFGKTSFFDAIEWSLSTKIRRLDEYVKNNPKARKLLLNKYSQKENAQIQITFDTNKVLERKTKLLGTRNHDYDGGVYSKDEENLEDKDFQTNINKSILSQDLISAFLRTTNAKERFNELKQFWDTKNQNESEKDSTKYNEIVESFTNIEKRRKEIISSLKSKNKQKEKEEKKLLIDESFKKLVTKYNEILPKDKSLLELKHSTNFEQFWILTNEELEKIKKEMKISNKSINDITNILKGIPTYQENIAKKDKRILAKKTNEQIVQYFNDLAKAKDTKKKSLYNFNDYLKLNTLYGNSIKNKEKILKLENYKEIQVNKLSVLREKEEVLLNKKIEFVIKSKTKLANYFDLKETILQLQKEKDKLDKEINITKINKKIYENIISINLDEINVISKDITELIINLNKDKKVYKEKKEELKEITDDIKKFTEYDSKYKELIEESLEYIKTDSNIRACPVCHTPFGQEELINKILSVVPSNSTLRVLHEKSLTLSESLTTLENTIKAKENNLLKYVKSEITKFNIDKLNEDYLDTTSKLKVYVSTKDELDAYMKKHLLEFKEKELFIENIPLSVYEEKLEEKTIKNKENLILIEKQNKKLLKIENQIQKRDKLKFYTLVNKLLEKYNFINKKQIEIELDEIINLLQKTNQDIEKLEKKVYLKDLNEYKNKLNEDIKNIGELEASNKKFKNSCEIYSKDIDSQYLSKLLIEHKSLLVEFEKLTKKIEKIISNIKNSINLINIKSEIRTLENKKESIEIKYISLKEVKETAEKFIQNKISSAFNLPLVNKIYQRIEPHPEFDEISFEPNLNGKNSTLEIKARKSGQDEILPILYFSAAQINVLSLSIFLAKTLQEENPKLNTIFIDDPIQHLDSINILSFIDLVRNITENKDRQLIIATHDESFYNLMQKKMPEEFFSSKYQKLVSVGKIEVNL